MEFLGSLIESRKNAYKRSSELYVEFVEIENKRKLCTDSIFDYSDMIRTTIKNQRMDYARFYLLPDESYGEGFIFDSKKNVINFYNIHLILAKWRESLLNPLGKDVVLIICKMVWGVHPYV